VVSAPRSRIASATRSDHAAEGHVERAPLRHGGCDTARMRTLEGRVVVITGASSGLGRETALQLAERGCRLVEALVAAARDR
jgi:hypothetical protein